MTTLMRNGRDRRSENPSGPTRYLSACCCPGPISGSHQGQRPSRLHRDRGNPPSALWGLSMTLHEGTEFVQGQVRDTNLDTYMPLRIGDVPELDIEFIDSAEFPVGLGEPGTTVVGPAIGNAIFAAVGARLRHLPIRPAAVLEALTRTKPAQ